MNLNATLVLGFAQDNNTVYSLIKLTPTQQTLYSTPAQWQGKFQDCEPQTLPEVLRSHGGRYKQGIRQAD